MKPTALERGRWKEVQERCDDVESLAGADYQDVRDLRRQAVAGLQRARAERERQAGLAQLYQCLQAAAVEGNWDEMLDLGGRIQALDMTCYQAIVTPSRFLVRFGSTESSHAARL